MNRPTNDNALHKESILTHAFTPWYVSRYNYVELFDDSDTSGSDPFDSGGIVNKELVFIEFKDSITLSQIEYEGSRGSSIEKKIGQLLTLLYYRIDSKIYNAVSDCLSNITVPKIILVVNKISSTSEGKLLAMLHRRAIDWQFSYELIRWDGKEGITLIKESPLFPQAILNNQIKIPHFPNTSKKRTNKLTYEKVISYMESIEQAENFKRLFTFFKDRGASVDWNATCVNIKFRKYNSLAMFGFWLPKSSLENGILFTYSLGMLTEFFQLNISSETDLQLKRNPFEVGNLGYNAYLKTIAEVDLFLAQLDSAVS